MRVLERVPTYAAGAAIQVVEKFLEQRGLLHVANRHQPATDAARFELDAEEVGGAGHDCCCKPSRREGARDTFGSARNVR